MDCFNFFCKEYKAIFSENKASYWIVDIDNPTTWILTSYRVVQPIVIVRYIGIPFGVNLSPIAMWY